MRTRRILQSVTACFGALLIGVCAPTLSIAAVSNQAPGISDRLPQIHDLGTLGGATSSAVAMNEWGDIAGNSKVADGTTHAFFFNRTTHKMRDLGVGTAVDINNLGQVVGNDAGRIFLWGRHAGRRDLGSLGGASAHATDLNDRDQIVGAIDANAFRWDPRQGLRDLGAGIATTINSRGQVAGLGDGQTGFFWDPRSGRQPITVNSDGLSEPITEIIGINDRGQVAGTAGQAFIWSKRDGGEPLDNLNPLSSQAYAINNHGQVVGHFLDSWLDEDFAFSWTEQTGMVAISEGLDVGATDVSDSGYVAGFAFTQARPDRRDAFRWTSSTGRQILAGLGGRLTTAVDVNNRGWVAGTADNIDGNAHAVAWYGSRRADWDHRIGSG